MANNFVRRLVHESDTRRGSGAYNANKNKELTVTPVRLESTITRAELAAMAAKLDGTS